MIVYLRNRRSERTSPNFKAKTIYSEIKLKWKIVQIFYPLKLKSHCRNKITFKH